MADAGVARSEGLHAGTLTRADLSDIVHNRLGVSRAESAGIVERVLHHMCHALSSQNVRFRASARSSARQGRAGRPNPIRRQVPIARRLMTFLATRSCRRDR